MNAGAVPARLETARGRALAWRLTPHLVLLGVVVIWSGNAVIVKLGLEHVRPVPFTAARFLIGGLAMMAVAMLRGNSITKVPRLRVLVPAALLGIVVNQLSFTYGVHLTTAVDVSLLMGVSPIAAAILVMLVARRTLPLRTLLALGLGFAGLLLVVFDTAHGGGSGSLLGDLVTLGAPISWAGYLVVVAGEAGRTPATVLTPWTMLVALIVLVPLAGIEIGTGADNWLAALPELAYSSILATGLAYTAYFWALPRLGVTGTAIYTYLQPAVGAAAGAVFLHEGFGSLQAVGAVAIVGAAYLGNLKPKALRRAG